MKKIKLKNTACITKRRIVTALFMSLCLTCLLTFYFVNSLSSNLMSFAKLKVKKENTLILKEAFSHSQKSAIDIDKIISVVKNSKEEIVEVNFDMKASTDLLSSITAYINDRIENYNFLGYRLDIAVGVLSSNPLLYNIGPKIPVKVELSDVALGNVRTTVKPFGINNALIEVYLDIIIRSMILYPFEAVESQDEFSSLIASKIIAGSIPNFYGGTINSKSDTINLPLGEEV